MVLPISLSDGFPRPLHKALRHQWFDLLEITLLKDAKRSLILERYSLKPLAIIVGPEAG